MPRKPHPVDTYVSAFTALTPENVEELYDLVAEDVFFSDPFNVIHGKAGFRQVFDHMYETCTDQIGRAHVRTPVTSQSRMPSSA